MIKHGVVMVTLLILTLTLVGVVSASDITASDVDLQSFNQENAQVEIDENNEISSIRKVLIHFRVNMEILLKFRPMRVHFRMFVNVLKFQMMGISFHILVMMKSMIHMMI